jgi:hypothetical protein
LQLFSCSYVFFSSKPFQYYESRADPRPIFHPDFRKSSGQPYESMANWLQKTGMPILKIFLISSVKSPKSRAPSGPLSC